MTIYVDKKNQLKKLTLFEKICLAAKNDSIGNHKTMAVILFFRFKFDNNIKSKLPEMLNDLKTKLFEVPSIRSYELYGRNPFGWVVDFSPDNVVNTALRKEELLDFALFNEGNVYNKLFYKVMRQKCFSKLSAVKSMFKSRCQRKSQ